MAHLGQKARLARLWAMHALARRPRAAIRRMTTGVTQDEGALRLDRGGHGPRQGGLDAQVFLAPAAHRFHYGDEVVSGIAQHVIHPRGHAFRDQPADDSIAFQFPQLGGQDFLAHSWEEIADLREATRAERKMPDN